MKNSGLRRRQSINSKQQVASKLRRKGSWKKALVSLILRKSQRISSRRESILRVQVGKGQWFPSKPLMIKNWWWNPCLGKNIAKSSKKISHSFVIFESLKTTIMITPHTSRHKGKSQEKSKDSWMNRKTLKLMRAPEFCPHRCLWVSVRRRAHVNL